MFFQKKRKIIEDVKACFDGEIIALEDVNDPMFAKKILGDGIAIQPTNHTLYAPVSGKVSAIFDTKHAIGFTLNNGAEILIHIGLDTVELEGEGFQLQVSVGDQVGAGDVIGKVDFESIKARGKEIITPILLTKTKQYLLQYKKTEGKVHAGDVLYQIVS